ncbi:MAG: hypothetical protein HZC41_11770 [Chloroflexi bacterium]|nr:hypothetical protein [Chloroflexota bacterium]
MPKREQLFNDLKGENSYGIFLAAQMGGVPNELQLIIQTARYDDAAQGLREGNAYIIRVLGVREHRITLGIFGNLFVASGEDHPILFHHNTPRVTLHFEGTARDIPELVLDIHQAYVLTFGPWRELAGDINRSQPLVNLLASGKGTLGSFPRPAAERLAKVLRHHGLSLTTDEEPFEAEDEHGRSRLMTLLGVGDSYFVALDYTVEQMGGQNQG